jgi:ribonuclease HII
LTEAGPHATLAGSGAAGPTGPGEKTRGAMKVAARGRRLEIHRGVELVCSDRFEEEARAAGHVAIAGVDEVGRGALCGPVVAAAVVLGPGFDCTGIDDSKRLTPGQREALGERIRGSARAWATGLAGPDEIDRLNILQATLVAMRRAVAALVPAADALLVDALTIPGLSLPQRAIVKGDALSFSIAAASVVAKLTRDALMRELDREYPGYGLAHNMGYASEDHRDALRRRGPSLIHRRTFQGTQRWLFA